MTNGTMTPAPPSPDLLRLIAAAQATTQAINNLNQTLSPFIGVLPRGATALSASGSGANSIVTASLPTIAGKTTWLTGFVVTAGGATTASLVNVGVNGLGASALVFTFGTPAGNSNIATPLIITFPTPLPSATPTTQIFVQVPAIGAGNTSANVVAFGFAL
jgi:hypothetical protein